MKKRKNSLIHNTGWGSSFFGELIPGLRKRGFSDYKIIKNIEGEKEKKETIEITTKAFWQRKTFQLIDSKYKTVEEALLAGKYDRSNPEINDCNFRFRERFSERRLIKFVKYCFDYKEIFYEAKKQGLERPTFEDALNFGAQYPNVQRNWPLIFLHEPYHSDRRVVVLFGDSSYRSITLGYFDGELSCDCLYPFVVRRK